MPFSCQDSVVSSETSGWGVCHRVPQSGVGVVNLGIRPVLVPPRPYRCRHGPCARKVEQFDSCSCAATMKQVVQTLISAHIGVGSL